VRDPSGKAKNGFGIVTTIVYLFGCVKTGLALCVATPTASLKRASFIEVFVDLWYDFWCDKK